MKIKFLIVIATFALIASCKSKGQKTKIEKDIDAQLVGKWQGEEKNEQVNGVTKSWEMNRKSDGTFKVQYTMNEDGEITKHSETGTWKTEGNLFYETNDYSGGTDVYTYQIINKDKIKFKAHNISVPMENANYEFFDIRMAN